MKPYDTCNIGYFHRMSKIKPDGSWRNKSITRIKKDGEAPEKE